MARFLSFFIGYSLITLVIPITILFILVQIAWESSDASLNFLAGKTHDED